jgi:glycosyltransferase involved in cell wall biosynthesis
VIIKMSKKLRIGVDARSLSNPTNGIGRYTHEILERVVRSDHEWFLYSNHPLTIRKWNETRVKFRYHSRSLNYTTNLWAQTVLPYWASRDEIDVFWGPGHRIPFLLPQNISRVLTVHDLVFKHAWRTMAWPNLVVESLLMPFAIKSADKVICVSESTLNDVRRLNPESAGKLVRIYEGHSTKLSKREHASYQKFTFQGPYILFVGTIEPRKNLENLLNAFYLLPEGIKEGVSLVIAGGAGWGGVDLAGLVDRLGLTGRVILLGRVEDDALADLYEGAHFLAMPSLYEGFGLPLVEAMAHGVPVLTSNISSMPEVAGEAGLLVDPWDVSSISQGMLTLFTDHELRGRLAAAATQVASRFSWDTCAVQTLGVLESASMNASR